MKKYRRRIVSIIILLAMFFVAAALYVEDYYRADDSVYSYLEENSAYSVAAMEDAYVLMPENPIAGIIFYPGAKVEYSAYLPLMGELAKEGIACVLLKMPFNLAMFDIDGAEDYIDLFPQVASWYLMGHSLGGSMAAINFYNNYEEYSGIILLASYSTKDLSDLGARALTIYGSEDEVLNKESFEKYQSNLPTDFTKVVIDGGCHSYFANYGLQDGDGKPTISREEQISLSVSTILDFIKN